jgi:hypothetical protein
MRGGARTDVAVVFEAPHSGGPHKAALLRWFYLLVGGDGVAATWVLEGLRVEVLGV